MKFSQIALAGCWTIELDLLVDERGWFARSFDAEEFRSRGMEPRVVQCSVSFNERAGTLRGLHYQAQPHGEPKLVRCVRGEIFDVAVDLRSDSATYLRWHGELLTAQNRRGLYIPAGMAHGFQTVVDDSEVLYQMGAPYVPQAGRGVRWDDPALAIKWPEPPPGGRLISEKDRSYADLEP